MGKENTGMIKEGSDFLRNMKIKTAGCVAVVARQAHNLKVEGSIPSPATNIKRECSLVGQSRGLLIPRA